MYSGRGKGDAWGGIRWMGSKKPNLVFFHKGKMCQQNSKLVHTRRREPAAVHFAVRPAQETFRLRRQMITSPSQIIPPNSRHREGK